MNPNDKENTMLYDTSIVAPVAPAHQGVAVTAAGLVRRYGEGDSAVEAVRGVSLEVPGGQFTAIMGACSPASTGPPRARWCSTGWSSRASTTAT
jgi:putative ABC transport system ATP-binding protein